MIRSQQGGVWWTGFLYGLIVIWLPVAPPFFQVLCNFKSLWTVIAQIVVCLWTIESRPSDSSLLWSAHDFSHQLHTQQITACISSIQSLRASYKDKKEGWLSVGVIAQWQSTGSLSQRLWVWFLAPPFLWALFHFEGLWTMTAQIVSLLWLDTITISLWTIEEFCPLDSSLLWSAHLFVTYSSHIFLEHLPSVSSIWGRRGGHQREQTPGPVQVAVQWRHSQPSAPHGSNLQRTPSSS